MAYDYIIVGAGSAGATLAARLSEDPSTSVLLLEAGPDYRSADAPHEMRSPNPAVIITRPEFSYPQLMARRTETQEPRLYWRGKGMGGSSAVNGQIAIRGMLDDFDLWAKDGCTAWSGADVLPYFIKLEDDANFGDEPYHGQGGPIPVYRSPRENWGPVDASLATAAQTLGYGWCDDHNAPEGTGVSPYAINSRNSVRISTNDGYLEPARARPNLKIVGDALVDRIEFDRCRALGVRVQIAGEWRFIEGGETLLCAGAVHSPAILQRSGAGDPTLLRGMDIDPVIESPMVGEQLQDHPMTAVVLVLKEDSRVSNPDFRHSNVCVRYSTEAAGTGQNDMMMVAGNIIGANTALGMSAVWVNQVFSRGWVRITSRDPEIDPQIEERMLSDGRDFVRLRDGVRRLFAMVNEPSLASVTMRVIVGSTNRTPREKWTDQDLEAFIMATSSDAQHATGTCRMGSVDDPRAVVDPECRLIGAESLRVIDASIMPEIVRANTHLTTVMIAEKMADRLKDASLS